MNLFPPIPENIPKLRRWRFGFTAANMCVREHGRDGDSSSFLCIEQKAIRRQRGSSSAQFREQPQRWFYLPLLSNYVVKKGKPAWAVKSLDLLPTCSETYAPTPNATTAVRARFH